MEKVQRNIVRHWRYKVPLEIPLMSVLKSSQTNFEALLNWSHKPFCQISTSRLDQDFTSFFMSRRVPDPFAKCFLLDKV